MAQALFVTRDDIVKFTALNGNIDTDKFVQFVKIAQDTHIQTYLGTQLFNKLNDDIVNDDLSEPYTTLLTKYIKPMVIHWSMVEALPFLAITIAGKGIYKHTSENATNVGSSAKITSEVVAGIPFVSYFGLFVTPICATMIDITPFSIKLG